MSTATEHRIPQHPHSETAVKPREYGLDWLRVFAFAVLIFYHSGMFYVPWGFHLKNPEVSVELSRVMLFFNRWRLPLLFFIAGCGVAFSLSRRGWGEFAWERTKRLLLPLLFGMLVVVPPQIYFERIYKGATFSYAEFYPSVFEFRPYPEGSFSWHHLWFVCYIFVYSLLGIPVLAAIRSDAGQRVLQAMLRLFEKVPPAIYLVQIPSLAAALMLGPHWPTTHNLISDWANLTGSFITFLWGFAVASTPGFLDHLERRRREFLILALLFTGGMYVMVFTNQARGIWWNVVTGYMGLLWIFTLVSWARHKIKSGGPLLTYATEAVYPFYILHQTIMIAAGYYIIRQPWQILPKLLLTMVVTFLGSWIGFELIRRWNVSRVLFGLKPR